MSGFLSINRKILEWEWYQDANTFRVFMHLLITANHKSGKWRGHTIGRGQTITGRLELAAALNLGEQQVRTSLNKLKATREITIKATKAFSLITICKYNVYQDKKEDGNQQDNQQTSRQITNDQPTSNQRVTTNNNDNKNNNDSTAEATPPAIISLEIIGIENVKKIADEVWRDKIWVEQLCMANGMKLEGTKDWMRQFNLSISQDTIPQFSASKYKKMFAGWLRGKLNNGQRVVKMTDKKQDDIANLKAMGI